MSTRNIVLGIAAAATLGLAALSTTPAAAQSWSLTIGSGAPYTEPAQYGWHDRGHGGWGRGPGWGYGHHRPRYGFHPGPQCFMRKVRYWDGWGWVVERRRVCH